MSVQAESALGRYCRHASLFVALLMAARSGFAISPEDIGLISQGAARGNDASQVLLATAYLNGGGGLSKDPVQAAHWFELAALQGNSYAEEKIGDLYESGIGVKANPALAFDWRLKAAQRGNVQAQVKLARMYMSGTGTAKDLGEAHDWLKRAAVEGSAEAQFLIGKMMHEGPDSFKRREQSRSWLEKAAKQGYIQAAELLNLIESIGYTVEESWHHRLPELTRLATDGDAEAQYQLALRYEHGSNGVKQDIAEALRWYRAAAENNHRLSMMALSQLLQNGAGVAHDPAAAQSWAERAAKSSR